MMRRQFIFIFIPLGVVLIFVSISFASFVIRKKEKTYIEDQTGERWDITQAKSIGLNPEGFQYGIVKTAFTPPDDLFLSDSSSLNFQKPRVIGIEDGKEARAYSVPKLRYHEIANSQINDKMIAVGY